jgi:NADPH2:quinone reductase
MKAGVASPNGVEIREVPEPRPKSNEILVKVRAIALNRSDLGAAMGDTSHGASAGAPIGIEFAGEVVETGSEVLEFKAGDRVMSHGAGSHAEYAVVDYARALPIPPDLSFEQASMLPVGLNTLHDALISKARLRPGESVLIQGASSGVGLLGLQIAKLKGAGLVFGSSTNETRRARLGEFGADVAVDTTDPNWPDKVFEASGGQGVDIVADMVSGATVTLSMKAMAIRGRMVNIGRLGGMTAEFDFDLHARKRIEYIGVTFRTRTLEEIREIVARVRADLWEAISSGKLRVPIDEIFTLDQAKAAHERMRMNLHFGKILLIP